MKTAKPHQATMDSSCSSEDASNSADDPSSASRFSSSGNNVVEANDGYSNEYQQVQRLAKSETARIRFCKFVVLGLILVTGVIVSCGTFFILTNNEEADYLEGYHTFALNVEDNSRFYARNMFDAVRDMAEMISLSAHKTNASFPFTTAEYFESRCRHFREQTGFVSVLWAPIVTKPQVDEWINYTVNHLDWLYESRFVEQVTTQAKIGRVESAHMSDHDSTFERDFVDTPVPPFIYVDQPDQKKEEYIPVTNDGPYAPIWQISPLADDMSFINQDILQVDYIRKAFEVIKVAREGVFAGYVNFEGLPHFLSGHDGIEDIEFHQHFSNITTEDEASLNPHSALIQPVFAELNNPESELVGLAHAPIQWDAYLLGLLPQGVNGVYCVLRNSCGESFTYKLKGLDATFIGVGELHEAQYEDTANVIPMDDILFHEVTPLLEGHCMWTITTYSSEEYHDSVRSSLPLIFTIAVAVIFLLVAITFVVYDLFVGQRNRKILTAAARANAILSSLFPKTVRDRLFEEQEQDLKVKSSYAAPKSHLNAFLQKNGQSAEDDDDDDIIVYDEKPIADLFPDTTILFADISGFTAWSSVREPAQVFILLETCYAAFDLIAKRRRVFKVETVGDCYVAVAGLPDPRKDHALVMARFAKDILFRFRNLTKKLELKLGPDTGDLDLRIGLHSGPVTAGVLRGARSRFQLFGDTMNTASRMESTSEKGCIQVSQDTADLIRAGGKETWLVERGQTVVAKGKGELQTYWIQLGSELKGSSATLSNTNHETSTNTDSEVDKNPSAYVSDAVEQEKMAVAEKMSRLVDWNNDVLLRLLKQIVARSTVTRKPDCAPREDRNGYERDHRTLDEVQEIIHLPQFDAKAAGVREDEARNSELPTAAVQQLRQYVSIIAQTYNHNPFHNFEHASHVTMSVVKLLSRIVAPSDLKCTDNSDESKVVQSLHDHTYGITSDPLTQFACVFSALIHDVDHYGVPNAQLVKEGTPIAKYYHGRSVAEQNSVDLAWELLMEPDYQDLRQVIYQTDAEYQRFRRLVVNAVMATDIVDKELKALRNERWAKAFSEGRALESARESNDRKATIVIEHLIQASDVAHTMQHWHIYRKWNERFFLECHQAWKEGRAEKDPAEGWYEGELGFFDFYIIPLAKKLKDCGVFGVSSDEYLNYAMKNRKEWEERGREVVDEMVQKVSM